MNARTKIWWIWGLWVFLTFLPLIAATVMVIFRMGFKLWIWFATLIVAIVAFFKAQQAAGRMRKLPNNLKIGRWLNSTKKKRDLVRKSKNNRGDRPARPVRRIGEVQQRFPQRKFWKALDHDSAVRHVGDLFYMLGMAVTNAQNLDRSNTCLLLDGETLVEFAGSETTPMPSDVRNFASYVGSKPSCRRGVLVSSQGFKRSVLQFADNTPLILLDSRDLARLGEHCLNE